MKAVTIILTILLVLISIALIVLVMMQESKDSGISSLAGGNSGSYAARNAGRTKEGKLKLYTRIGLIAFMVIALALNIIG